MNDVSALRADPEMAGVIADSGAECCLMHMLGEPRTMQRDPRYEDVVDEVRAFLEERLRFAVGEGVAEERIMLDPGIGFGKTVAHNLELLRRLDELAALGRPLVIGTSRKSFLGRIAADAAGLAEPLDAQHRLAGTIATNVLALERGASVFRVHDVAPVREALAVAAATLGGRWTDSTPARRHDDPDDGEDEPPGRAGRDRSSTTTRRGRRGRRTARTSSTRIATTTIPERGAESVTIEITGLSLYTHHGVSEAEREVGQRLVLDLRLDVGETDATATDALEDTIDYAEVCQLVALVAQQRSHKTLERLCSVVADRLLGDYALEGVWVKATKPEPPIPLSVDEVSVEIWREAEE